MIWNCWMKPQERRNWKDFIVPTKEWMRDMLHLHSKMTYQKRHNILFKYL
uniref:Predicted protein n=1 Tax=Hordeum vulgare subsp. vulgare TaxID=112509 RepID=F2E7D4_HORVV|nr:predicted protein [Hordeum vulgare subsp. vulgare]